MPRILAPVSLGLLLLAACEPEPTVTPDEIGQEVAPESTKRPVVDVKAMMASIEWLASDERQGRYTLAPEIETAATWISERYQELGLGPVSGAEALRVGYRLRTKVEVGEGSRLALTRKGKASEVAADQFTPRAEGISGTAKGELVFVGYGVSWSRPGETTIDPAIESWDDLAGVDLKGKVALVLAHAPNTPDFFELFGAMQKLAEDFEAAAAPLREKNDLTKLTKLHKKAREDLVELASPFVDVKDLGDKYWKVDDPKSPVDIMTLASVFIGRAASRPQFEDPTFTSHAAKVARLAEAGAIGVVIVKGPRSFIGNAARKADALPGPTEVRSSGTSVSIIPDPAAIPVVQMKWTSADKLLSIGGKKISQIQAAIDGDFKPRSQALGIEVELDTKLVDQSTDVPNVLAQLPGKSDEIILLGAHFDHIGNDQTGTCRAIVRRDTRDAICNGADDNASGTAMLLELARIYKQSGVTPERTIVFAHFSGEEIGLLGSRAVMSNSPFDEHRVVAMVNLDMVGRLGPRGLAIGGIGSSNDWMPLLDELGNYGMPILYEGSTTTRSDHAHWFRKQFPVLFFFTGVHADYHRAGDEIDEINIEGLGSIGQMVSDLVWELASGRAIAWTPPVHGDGIGAGLPGTDPATVIKRINADGSPMAAEE